MGKISSETISTIGGPEDNSTPGSVNRIDGGGWCAARTLVVSYARLKGSFIPTSSSCNCRMHNRDRIYHSRNN